MADRVEQHVQTLLATQSADPADHKRLRPETQRAPGGGAIERRPRPPGVRDHVDPLRVNARTHEPRLERLRHHDHRVEAPERATLQPLVHAVLPVPAGEAVHGRDHGNPGTPSDARVQHVRPVPVRMDDRRPQPPAQLRHRAALAPVPPRARQHDVRLHARVGERGEKWVIHSRPCQDRGDVDVMTRPALLPGEPLHDPLEATHVGWRRDVEDQHGTMRPASGQDVGRPCRLDVGLAALVAQQRIDEELRGPVESLV